MKYAFWVPLCTILFSLFGATLNHSAMALNGGKMPVDASVAWWNVVDSRHKEIDEATEAVWLCDIFPVKDAGGQIVAVQSIGDIFIELAVFVVHLNLCFLFALGIYEAKKSLKPKKDL